MSKKAILDNIIKEIYTNLLRNTINKIKDIVKKYHPIKLYYFCLKPVKNQRLYIHIGMPKTGSSAIQAFLALNKKYLKKNGFSYPNHIGFKQAFQTSSGNATDIYVWIKNDNRKIFERFISKARSQNVILSSEILYSSLKENPKKFAQFFSNYDIKIICYIREMGDLAESVINQMIKNHNMVDYSNIAGNIAGFNYYNCLLEACKHINAEKIIVKKYAKDCFYKGNIYSDFMKILNLNITERVIYPDKVVNPSLNRDALEFRILLNKLLFAKKDIQNKYKINGLLAGYSVSSSNPTKFALITPEMRKLITNNYRDLDEQLKSLFFNNDEESIFSSSSEDYNPYQGLTINSIAKILTFIQDNDNEFYFELINFINNARLDLKSRNKILSAVKLLNQ